MRYSQAPITDKHLRDLGGRFGHPAHRVTRAQVADTGIYERTAHQRAAVGSSVVGVLLMIDLRGAPRCGMVPVSASESGPC